MKWLFNFVLMLMNGLFAIGFWFGLFLAIFTQSMQFIFLSIVCMVMGIYSMFLMGKIKEE
jgi:hypothetical protein